MNWLQRLMDAGFRLVGSWKLTDSALSYQLALHASASDILYAFVSDGQVMYIGKTTMPLSKRMYGYQNPGPTQLTNIANNAQLRQLLNSGHSVEIYILLDTSNLQHAGFRVSLAAGLEDSLIGTIRPPWNKNGR
jgi:hypothetical protein